MSTDLIKKYTIGDTVYQFYKPFVAGAPEGYDSQNTDWLDAKVEDLDAEAVYGYKVKKITKERIYVYDFGKGRRKDVFVLDRNQLETRGWTSCNSKGHKGVYWALMPEAYRRKTIGFIAGWQDKEFLGLDPKEDYTDEEIKAAFRKRSMEVHPDTDKGSKADIHDLVKARDRLIEGASLGQMLGLVKNLFEKKMCPNCFKKNVKVVTADTNHCNECGWFF